jgi:glucan 1,3-beta-glucosidase
MTKPTAFYGVNLGGWLLLERWMTPSLFSGMGVDDEYSFMQVAGARQKIERHRKSFITEADFKWLQQNHISAVRIPVGYWLFDGDAPYTPTVKYLDWAMKMAEKYKLKVLIDLHGLKGSQNGKDHSGRIGKSEWHRHASYREQTIVTLEKIAERYYDSPALWGIELANEPKYGWIQWKLRRFYRQAYKRLVKVAKPGTVIVFHDAFTPRLMSGVIGGRASHPVMMDVHWYHFGSVSYVWRSIKRYLQAVKARPRLIAKLQAVQPIIVGEWSIVLAGEKLAGKTDAEKAALQKQHGDVQLAAYSTVAGWFYWNYKTEARGNWNFRSLIEDKVISLK